MQHYLDLLFELLLLAPFALLVVGSPGPANLAIAGTAMGSGRTSAVCIAAGIVTASVTWSASSALGLTALLLWQDWVIEVIRYAGATYLSYLSYRCIKGALSHSGGNHTPLFHGLSGRRAYMRGLMIHAANPKAVLFHSSFYALVLALGVEKTDLWFVVIFLAFLCGSVFFGYAFLFSSPPMVRLYQRSERGSNAVMGVLFIVAVIGMLMAEF